jgi:D-arabinose 1-dehydrogenase-like Zn-dependent alcohol dehydrogenase
MKAMLLTGHGGPEMLRYGDAPDPIPAVGEIVVDIHAASINAADYKVRLGGHGYSLRFPHILGRDFSGAVAETAKAWPILRLAILCSASLIPGLKARMQKNLPSAPRSSLISP